MKLDLPSHYWDFIEDFLPDYFHRDEVLLSDIYTRYLDSEDVDPQDIKNIFANRSDEDIKQTYLENEWKLFLEAFEAFAEEKYGEKRKQVIKSVEPFGNLGFRSLSDGAFYSYTYHGTEIAQTVDEFLKSRLAAEEFVFEVTGFIDDTIMEKLNGIPTADRLKLLPSLKCDLRFVKPANEVTRINLIKSCGIEMPVIVGEMLKYFYLDKSCRRTSMEDCIKYLAAYDVAHYRFDDLKDAYKIKIIQLVQSIFTGMRLDTPWDGRQETHYGSIIVRNDCDMKSLFPNRANEFTDFLISNMYVGKPTKSRHKDMVIYKEDGKYFLKLALQLRFVLNR